VNAAAALRFVEKHGIVLESARHASVLSLAQAIAGGPIRGSWWSHPEGPAIFAVTRALREAPEVLVCRIVDGKVSFAHERIWPALVRLADRFPRRDLARVRETHTASGAHRVENVAFPKWVPAATAAAAERMTDADARATLEPLLPGLSRTT
jgi:hypothetical protein